MAQMQPLRTTGKVRKEKILIVVSASLARLAQVTMERDGVLTTREDLLNNKLMNPNYNMLLKII